MAKKNTSKKTTKINKDKTIIEAIEEEEDIIKKTMKIVIIETKDNTVTIENIEIIEITSAKTMKNNSIKVKDKIMINVIIVDAEINKLNYCYIFIRYFIFCFFCWIFIFWQGFVFATKTKVSNFCNWLFLLTLLNKSTILLTSDLTAIILFWMNVSFTAIALYVFRILFSEQDLNLFFFKFELVCSLFFT